MHDVCKEFKPCTQLEKTRAIGELGNWGKQSNSIKSKPSNGGIGELRNIGGIGGIGELVNWGIGALGNLGVCWFLQACILGRIFGTFYFLGFFTFWI